MSTRINLITSMIYLTDIEEKHGSEFKNYNIKFCSTLQLMQIIKKQNILKHDVSSIIPSTTTIYKLSNGQYIRLQYHFLQAFTPKLLNIFNLMILHLSLRYFHQVTSRVHPTKIQLNRQTTIYKKQSTRILIHNQSDLPFIQLPVQGIQSLMHIHPKLTTYQSRKAAGQYYILFVY